MFQCVKHIRGSRASEYSIVEDTDLITLTEAEGLWNKNYSWIAEDIKDGHHPQMCIWQNCKNNTDYGDILKQIDGRDRLEVQDGIIYKLTITQL